MRKLNGLAAILTIVGGLNWGLVGLFKFDLVAAVFGGMQVRRGERRQPHRLHPRRAVRALPGHPADAHQHLGANPRNLGHQLNEFRRDHAMLRLLTLVAPQWPACSARSGRRLQQHRCRDHWGPDARPVHDRRIDDRVGPVRGRLLDRAGQRPRQPRSPGSGPGGHRRLQYLPVVDPGDRGQEGRPGQHLLNSASRASPCSHPPTTPSPRCSSPPRTRPWATLAAC